MEYFTINATGRANLVEFLRGILKNPDNAERHADAICSEYMGDDPGRSHYVEIGSIYTRRGNPELYSFDPATELTLNTVEE